MQTVKAFRGNARTFLTHMFGRGLDDDRYVIERFPVEGRRRDPSPAPQRGLEEEPGQDFPRDRLPEHRPTDEARARRDHRLHRHRHHRWNSILGRSRDGLAGERQVSLRCYPRRRPAAPATDGRSSSVPLLRKGRTCHSRIPKRNAHAPGGAINALPPSGPPAACAQGAARRSQCPIAPCAVPAAISGAGRSVRAMRRPRPPVCCTPAEMPNGAAGARVTGASGATGHGRRLACARVAASTSPLKAERCANPAASTSVKVSGNNMPRGVQLASAADAVRPPPTAARGVSGAPGARPNPQGRKRRTPEAAGVTSGAGCEGFA